jgi:transcriptional pleiotropic regulator of transition state genes
MLKNTGMIRPIDELGRLVFPKELRDVMDIKQGDKMEIYTQPGKIILKKHEVGCIFCHNLENLTEYKGTTICKYCREDMAIKE